MIYSPSPSPVVPFKEKYPIDFSIRNVNNEAVLYIGDPGETLRVEIMNDSAAPITIPVGANAWPKPVEPGMFQLRFRPGILANVENIKLTTPNWTMVPTTDPDGVSLSFTTKQSLTGTKPVTLMPGELLELTLTNVVVSPCGGSRETNVELRYQNLLRGTQELIQGERLKHFTVLNHQGAKNIPLHVGFVQSNRVVNDGVSSSVLKLRIANTMKLDPDHPDRSVITLHDSQHEAPSRLIFSFVAGGSEMDWALGTDSQVKAIRINDFAAIGDVVQPAEQKVEPKQATITIHRVAADANRKDTDVHWKVWAEKLGECFELTLEPLEQAQLESGEYIDLIFSNIVTGHPSGITNLEMHYKSIADYWDGQFSCPIEKTPLLLVETVKRQQELIDKLTDRIAVLEAKKV